MADFGAMFDYKRKYTHIRYQIMNCHYAVAIRTTMYIHSIEFSYNIHSYGHLSIITGYFNGIIYSINGVFLVLITGITWAITVIKHRVVPSKSGLTWDAHCAVRAEVLREARAWADSGTPKENWGLWLDFKGGLMINVY